MAREGRAKKEETPTKPIPKSTKATLSIGQLSQVLGVGANSIKKAMRKGDRSFAQYCFEKSGRRFNAIDVSKPEAKIPRWHFVEED